jgi:uncharacterized protein (DUF362 family)
VAVIPSAVDIMSSASPGWKTTDPVVASGEVDGEALRKRHRARIAADKSAVSLVAGGTPRELGERLCKAVVPDRPKDTPILIKPNIGGFEWFKDPEKTGGDDGIRGRITDPEFVRGIVRCLKARGHPPAKITVAEGWGSTHAFWEKLAKVSGYDAMTRAEGVALVAMDDDGVFDVEGAQPGKALRVKGMEATHAPTLLMPKILAEHLEHGLFISAPKVKAHRFGVVSMAIKGGQGTVMLSDASPAFNQKWRMHKELRAALDLLPKDREAGKKAYVESLNLFSERMADVLEVSAPDVVLAEGAPAMGGDGFGKRWSSAESVAIGGTNPILVDRVGAAFLGLWDNADLARELAGHKTSPLLEVAAKRFGVDIRSPVVEGDGAALLQERRPVHFVSMSGFAIHSDDRGPDVPKPDPGSSSSKSVTAGKVDAITIDGVIDDAWSKIGATTFDTDWSGAATETRTKVRFAWKKDALFALFEIENAGINVDPERPKDVERKRLYEEDCVEIFLAPDASERARYYELEVGPLGHFLDVAVDRTGKPVKANVEWSAKAEIATKVDRPAKRATIEIAIRAPEIVMALRAGAQLPLGIYRMEGKSPRQFLAWSPTRTPKPDFHVPEAFGTLVLE